MSLALVARKREHTQTVPLYHSIALYELEAILALKLSCSCESKQ